MSAAVQRLRDLDGLCDSDVGCVVGCFAKAPRSFDGALFGLYEAAKSVVPSAESRGGRGTIANERVRVL